MVTGRVDPREDCKYGSDCRNQHACGYNMLQTPKQPQFGRKFPVKTVEPTPHTKISLQALHCTGPPWRCSRRQRGTEPWADIKEAEEPTHTTTHERTANTDLTIATTQHTTNYNEEFGIGWQSDAGVTHCCQKECNSGQPVLFGFLTC